MTEVEEKNYEVMIVDVELIKEARKLYDYVYGGITDSNWQKCKYLWTSDIDWLREQAQSLRNRKIAVLAKQNKTLNDLLPPKTPKIHPKISISCPLPRQIPFALPDKQDEKKVDVEPKKPFNEGDEDFVYVNPS